MLNAILNNQPVDNKLRILLVYAKSPTLGNITLPEWIKEAFRAYYYNSIDVYACGPNNDINIPDSPQFYDEVELLVKQLYIDFVWDIDGWIPSHDFAFRRLPVNLSVPKVYWAIDTHQFLQDQIKKSRYFDLTFSAMKNTVAAFGPDAYWLPVGASIYEKDYNLPRTLEIGFIGNIIPGLHERRKRIIEKLQKEFPQFICLNNVFLEEKAKIVSQMKIMINISLNNDLNLRVFETLACGALLITDRIIGNGMEDLFVDGEHLVLFDDENDLVQKIQYYLTHEDERARIAYQGKIHVEKHLTHKNVIFFALNCIYPLLRKNFSSKSEEKIRPCWCHGKLLDSVHPAYYVCSKCGTHVSRYSTTAEDLKKFYSLNGYWRDYQEKLAGYPPIEVRAVSDFNDRIPYWFSLVSRYSSKPKTILEIGCSHGGFLAFCRQQGIETVVGVEVDEETCCFAREHFKLPYVISGLFPSVELPLKSFDLITGFDVIEHFGNPQNDIAAISKLLSPEGTFIFQTPCYRGEDASWQQFKPEEHLYLFNAETVKELFDHAGLEVTDILPGFFADDMFVIGRRKKQQRILFLRTDAIGDNVLASAMLPYLRKEFENASLVLVCQDRVAPLYDACPYIDELLSYSLMDLYHNEEYRQDIVQLLNALKPDMLINTVYSRDYQNFYLSSACNAPVKITIEGDTCNIAEDLKREYDKCFTAIVPNAPQCRQELERHAYFLGTLGLQVPKLQPLVWVAKHDYALAEALLQELNLEPEKTLVIFPGSLIEKKKYPYFHKVLRGLYGYTLLMLGGSDAEQHCKELSIAFPGRAFNLAGKTSILQMAAVMSKARLYVGVDTSGAHVACAVGLPNVVLLGGGHFGRFLPYSVLTTAVCFPLECYNCNWQCRYSRCHCVDDIRPDVVLSAVKYSLTKRKQTPTMYRQLQSSCLDSPPSLHWSQLSSMLDLETVEIVDG